MKAKACRRGLGERLAELAPVVLRTATETRSDAADFPLNTGDTLLDLISHVLYLLLYFTKLFEIHLTLDVTFDIIDVTLGATQQCADRPCGNRQPLWTDHHQGNEPNQN